MSSIVEMKNVYKSFGPVEVLKDFSPKLAEGEKVVIIGPSGSGKTTLTGHLMQTVDPARLTAATPRGMG